MAQFKSSIHYLICALDNIKILLEIEIALGVFAMFKVISSL